MSTNYTHRFFVVPAAHRATAKALCKQMADAVSPGSADGMFDSQCNATGTGAATDYLSCGPIDANFAALLGNAAATFAAYQASGGTTVTLAQVQALYAACPLGTRIRDDLGGPGGAQEGLAALGLKLTGGEA